MEKPLSQSFSLYISTLSFPCVSSYPTLLSIPTHIHSLFFSFAPPHLLSLSLHPDYGRRWSSGLSGCVRPQQPAVRQLQHRPSPPPAEPVAHPQPEGGSQVLIHTPREQWLCVCRAHSRAITRVGTRGRQASRQADWVTRLSVNMYGVPLGGDPGPDPNVRTYGLWGAFPLNLWGLRAVQLSHRQVHEGSCTDIFSPSCTLSVRPHFWRLAWGI